MIGLLSPTKAQTRLFIPVVLETFFLIITVKNAWNPSELFSDLPTMITSLAILGEVVVGAGEDFTDENSYINERFINTAKEKLSGVLNSEVETVTVLDTFGWSR